MLHQYELHDQSAVRFLWSAQSGPKYQAQQMQWLPTMLGWGQFQKERFFLLDKEVRKPKLNQQWLLKRQVRGVLAGGEEMQKRASEKTN